MKILNVIQCTNLGGMEKSTLHLMKALQAKGHQIELISLRPLGALKPLLDEARIPAQGLQYGDQNFLLFIYNLRRAICKANADALIMTGHNFISSLALVGLKPDRRLMSIRYHHEGVMSPLRWKIIYTPIFMLFDAVIFPSDFVRLEAEALFPLIKRKSRTIRNPRQTTVSKKGPLGQAFRSTYGIPEDAPLVGNAGWLIRRKRFDVFIETAAKIVALEPRAHFVISGDGEMKGELVAKSKALGVENKIVWTGWLDDMSSFYEAVDVVLFNSDWDAFGNIPIEALAHGKPVVASLINCGVKEILNSTNSWVTNQHDGHWLAHSVISALGPEGRQKAERGRRLVAEAFNPEIIADEVERSLALDHSST
ncbi:glycosyltransferase family 4 protein [Cereibacter sphaeroides]|uniref:glycosyltransferase family 4 protein n=1 Tax=Cereibacter sphaeroides TaxID=1063 RepID=UPI003FCE2F9C